MDRLAQQGPDQRLTTVNMASSSLEAEISVATISVVAPQAAPARYSHAQILKSTALIGGSSVVNIAFGIVRAKAMAVLLGPSGVGLMGLYSSVAEVTQSLAGMGIQSSGV